MKKLLFTVVCFMTSYFSFSQTLAEVNLNLAKGDYAKAKEVIDKMIASPKYANDASTYYWKGYVYRLLAKSDKTASLCADCRMDAFEAIKKYLQLDPTQKETKGDTNSIMYDIYLNYYDLAAKDYNNKNYQSAYDNFLKTLATEEYLFKNNLPGPAGLKANELDVDAILFAGFSAQELQKKDDAAKMFQRIIDAGLNDPKYLATYEDQAEYYFKNNDLEKWKDVVEKGKKAFPNNDYWYQIEVDQVVKTGDKEAVCAKYEELLKQRPQSFVLNFNYSVELFNYIYTSEKKPADIIARKNRLTEVLKNTMPLDTTIESTMLLARHMDYYSGDQIDASRAIKGTKPEDVKKKNELKASAVKLADDAIIYADKAAQHYKALATLKGSQKISLKSAYDILSRAYDLKGDAKKAAEYQTLKNAVQ